MTTKLYTHIVADTSILGGQPIIEGTEIPVSLLVTGAAVGKSLETIAAEAGVTVDDVRAALNFAAQRASEPAIGSASKTTPATAMDAYSPVEDEINSEARRLGMNPATLSPLVRRLLSLRLRGAEDGIQAITSWDELEAERMDRRGGDDGAAADPAQ